MLEQVTHRFLCITIQLCTMGIYSPSIGGNILHSGHSDERVDQLYCGCWHTAVDVSVGTNGHIFRRIRRKAWQGQTRSS